MSGRVVCALALLIVCGSALAAADQGAGPGISKDEETALSARLVKARELIEAHQPAKAIEAYLDPVIARYTEVYAASPRVVFCAREPAESLIYLLAVAGAGAKGAPAGEAIVIGPNWADAYLLKGYAQVELGDRTAAEATLKRAVALSPQDPQYLSELACVTQQLGASAEALTLYASAQDAAALLGDAGRKRAESARACRGQGYALVELKRLDEAEAKYLSCIAIDPADRISPGELEYVRKLRAGK